MPTQKLPNGKYENIGAKGGHGEMSKEAADAQRKAMFANGFKEPKGKKAKAKKRSNIHDIVSEAYDKVEAKHKDKK